MNEVGAILITGLLAAFIAGWAVISQRIVVRRQSTIEHLSQKDADKDMIEARECYNVLSDPDGKLSTYTKPADLTTEESNKIRLILNDYELIAVGIQFGIFDLKIVKQLIRGTAVRDWARTAPYIYKLRSEVDNPLIYYEFENLVQWLQDKPNPKRRIWTRLWF